MGDNVLTIGLLALLAVMVFFMFRNSRKRRRDAEEMAAKLQPGAEVMTQHGIYGTLISIDDEKNEAVIETTPGTRLRVHRQTVARVIDPVVADEDVIADVETDADEVPEVESIDETRARLEGGEPQYGERVDDEKPKRTTRKKATE
jgi:preprotein translocase subunit YajC